MPKPALYSIMEEDQSTAKEICDFLEGAALATEHQSVGGKLRYIKFDIENF